MTHYSELTHLKMNDDIIIAPPHYVQGRTIQPCEIMESWGLIQNHYISCAFKYVARAGRKGDERSDYNKAIWYLERFLEKGMTMQNHIEKNPISLKDVIADWEGTDRNIELEVFYDIATGRKESVGFLLEILFIGQFRKEDLR